MPRLIFALISVLAHVAAQETRINDPAAAAIGEKARLYELIKAEYTDEGCEAAGWGPFPNATSTTLTAEAYAQAHDTSGCKCGMLYGLAHSSLHRAEDVNAASLSSTAQGPALCSGGSAAGFPCDGVDLIAHLPLSAFRTNTSSSNAPNPNPVACAAPAYEQAIALPPPRPLSPAGPSPQPAHVRPPVSQFCA